MIEIIESTSQQSHVSVKFVQTLGLFSVHTTEVLSRSPYLVRTHRGLCYVFEALEGTEDAQNAMIHAIRTGEFRLDTGPCLRILDDGLFM